MCVCLLTDHIEEQKKRNQGEGDGDGSIIKIDYKAAYADAIRKVYQTYKIDALITGDINFVGNATSNFKQQVCKEHECSGVKCLIPLWQQTCKALLKEMVLRHDMDIRMCCVKTPHLNESWIGRRIYAAAILELELKGQQGLDLTGENGEYHTMVVGGGPMYKKIELWFKI